MSSPRYLAEHLIMPRYLREKGAAAALDAVERNDADFFIPVWIEAGFRFSPRFFYQAADGRQDRRADAADAARADRAWLAAIVGAASDPACPAVFPVGEKRIGARRPAAHGAKRMVGLEPPELRRRAAVHRRPRERLRGVHCASRADLRHLSYVDATFFASDLTSRFWRLIPRGRAARTVLAPYGSRAISQRMSYSQE
jgi:hypothetical protein